MKKCNWVYYDTLIASLDTVYLCKNCNKKIRVKQYEVPPTVSTNNRCYNDD
jgi:hypothetical protein